MAEKTFGEIRDRIEQYLRDSKTENPYNVVNQYLEQISVERRISEAEELLTLIRKAMTKQPNTLEDRYRSGSPGVIVMGSHYAYPLQLTLLGWWVYAHLDAVKDLNPEDKRALHNRLIEGINYFDVYGHDRDRYDYLIDGLVETPETPKKQKVNLFQRIKSVLGF